VGPNGHSSWEVRVAATRFFHASDVPGLLRPSPSAAKAQEPEAPANGKRNSPIPALFRRKAA
jgi:hypothetical protein